MSKNIIDGLKKEIATKIDILITNGSEYNTYRKTRKSGLI